MRISIVTPSYNQGQFIEDAIKSVLKQDWPDFELEHIIIDNCSTDETIQILKKYPHLRWISEPDKGQSDAINKGFKLASGDIIGWLNADDYYLEGALKRVVQVFREEPHVDVVYGDVRFVDESRTVLRRRRSLDFDKWMLLYYGCYIPSTAAFFRQGILEQGFFLNEDYACAMDFEFFVRLAFAGYRFRYVPEMLASFRWHENNVSKRLGQRRREERIRVQQRYGVRFFLDSRMNQKLYDVLARLYQCKRLFLRLFLTFK